MKRIPFTILLLLSLFLPVFASGKPNTVLIHPGEVVYVRFEQQGKKIKLQGFTTEKDPAAQVIFTFVKGTKDQLSSLKIENLFSQDLTYKGEIRSSVLKKHFPAYVSPVVAKKVGYEKFPPVVDEFAAYDFQLVK